MYVLFFVELYLLWWWFSLCLVVPLFVTLLGADVKFLDIVVGVYTVLLVDVDCPHYEGKLSTV